jgi:hypothetical protein
MTAIDRAFADQGADITAGSPSEQSLQLGLDLAAVVAALAIYTGAITSLDSPSQIPDRKPAFRTMDRRLRT